MEGICLKTLFKKFRPKQSQNLASFLFAEIPTMYIILVTSVHILTINRLTLQTGFAVSKGLVSQAPGTTVAVT